MEFFDKLSETIVSAGKDVGQKAKDVSGIAKLKMDIRSKEDFVRNLFNGRIAVPEQFLGIIDLFCQDILDDRRSKFFFKFP